MRKPTPVTMSAHQRARGSPQRPRVTASSPPAAQRQRGKTRTCPGSRERSWSQAATPWRKASPTVPDPMAARLRWLKRCRASAVTTAPASGQRRSPGGYEADTIATASLPAFSQEIDLVHVLAVLPPEDQHQNSQADGHLGRGHGDHHEGEDMGGHGLQPPPQGDEGQVGPVPHELHAHEEDQRVPPDHEAQPTQHEEDQTDQEVGSQRHLTTPPRPGRPAAFGAGGPPGGPPRSRPPSGPGPGPQRPADEWSTAPDRTGPPRRSRPPRARPGPGQPPPPAAGRSAAGPPPARPAIPGPVRGWDPWQGVWRARSRARPRRGRGPSPRPRRR